MSTCPSTHNSNGANVVATLSLLVLGSAAGGAALGWWTKTWLDDNRRRNTSSSSSSYSSSSSVIHHAKQNVTVKDNKNQTAAAAEDPAEKDHSVGHALVWKNISGALNSAMMYAGDRLDLYSTLADQCQPPGSSVTAVTLAKETGYNQRWLREWLAHQAAMGILRLLPGEGDDDADLHYRLPAAMAEVLANPNSREYDIAHIQMIPALVYRAKTMLPAAFQSGTGRPYDEPDVADAINRAHQRHIRDIFIPDVLRQVQGGIWHEKLLHASKNNTTKNPIKVADLGCGAGVMLLSLAQMYTNVEFHGYDISKVALDKALHNTRSLRLTNVTWHDASCPGESLGDCDGIYDLIVIYDVLHDCTFPLNLIQQVRRALKRDTGIFLLGDIQCAPTIRENLQQVAAPDVYLAFSTCLCMSSSLSEPGGSGLGTLGFSVPVAQKLLTQGGFTHIEVFLEKDKVRWFLVT